MYPIFYLLKGTIAGNEGMEKEMATTIWFRVWCLGLGFWFQFGFRVWVLQFSVWSLGFRFYSL